MRRLALVVLLAAACAERTPPPDEPLVDLDDQARAEATSPAVAEEKAAPAPPRRRSGEIRRADLERVLEAGPGRLLARVEVKASVTAGRFTGWEVVRNPWADVDLVAGDVILSVNGRTLEHPLELKVLWDDLRTASSIAVEVKRKGTTFALDFAIVPAAAAPASGTP